LSRYSVSQSLHAQDSSHFAFLCNSGAEVVIELPTPAGTAATKIPAATKTSTKATATAAKTSPTPTTVSTPVTTATAIGKATKDLCQNHALPKSAATAAVSSSSSSASRRGDD
jgi:hypothetical protein